MIRLLLTLLAILLSASLASAFQAATVPGATDPRVTQDTVAQTICVRGYTKTVRPPVTYTIMLKHQLMVDQSLPGTPRDYELDHFIPLELGGDPRSTDNLWMQPIKEAHVKDKDENHLHDAVCAGTTTLEDARNALRRKWGPKQP